MAGAIKKPTGPRKPKKNYDGIVSVLRFNDLRTSSLKKCHDAGNYSKAKSPSHSKAFNEQRMFAASKLPNIPEPASELKILLERLKTDKSSEIADKKRNAKRYKRKNPNDKDGSKKPKTKLNAFMAYRSYHSRDVKSTDDQRELSACLAKMWAKEEAQLVWRRYAAEYNAYTENFSKIPFVEWLLKSSGSESKQDKEERVWKENMESGHRVQDLYFDDQNSEITLSTASKTFDDKIFKGNQPMDVTGLNFKDVFGLNTKHTNVIDPFIESLQNNAFPPNNHNGFN